MYKAYPYLTRGVQFRRRDFPEKSRSRSPSKIYENSHIRRYKRANMNMRTPQRLYYTKNSTYAYISLQSFPPRYMCDVRKLNSEFMSDTCIPRDEYKLSRRKRPKRKKCTRLRKENAKERAVGVIAYTNPFRSLGQVWRTRKSANPPGWLIFAACLRLGIHNNAHIITAVVSAEPPAVICYKLYSREGGPGSENKRPPAINHLYDLKFCSAN